eukprot:3701620-Pleurochrysis_carterae.AAC.1
MKRTKFCDRLRAVGLYVARDVFAAAIFRSSHCPLSARGLLVAAPSTSGRCWRTTAAMSRSTASKARTTAPCSTRSTRQREEPLRDAARGTHGMRASAGRGASGARDPARGREGRVNLQQDSSRERRGASVSGAMLL